MKSSSPKIVATLAIETEFGKFYARYSEDGLAELRFPREKMQADATASVKIKAWHKTTSQALQCVLAKSTVDALPPLDLCGTAFQKSVWTALRKISAGQTLSYAQLAKGIGRPKAVRAVGGACGANPIPVLIPCHRVLAANKKIGGFSGGLEWKQKLLSIENVAYLTAA